MKNELTALRKRGYVIPPSCALCKFARDTLPVDVVICTLLDTVACSYGHCDEFKPDPLLVKRIEHFKPLLERRAYTRSNRHKAKTTY